MIYASGTRAYCRFDAKHNSRGPAVIYCDGDIEYWERDQLHRHDGPAVIGTDGVEEYHLYGNLHCLTGKAIRWRNDDNPYAANLVPSYFRRDNLPIYPSLSPSYFIHGKAYLSEHDYWNAVRLHNTRLKIESHK